MPPAIGFLPGLRRSGDDFVRPPERVWQNARVPTALLLVEDDPAIAHTVVYALQREGFQVDHVLLLREALQRLHDPSAHYAALILDLGLPDGSGLDLCRELRHTSNLPIVMLSARGEEMDRVLGLELGADDYLTKPFSLAELLARVKALLRRASLLAAAQASAQSQPKAIRNGELEILPAKRQVTWRGKAIDFTALEFDLLLHFASHPGHVFSRSQLLNAVWGYTHDGYEHTVTTHINRLRGKLEADPMRPELILTARGAGYKMRDAP